MASQSDTIPMQETAGIVRNDGSKNHAKDRTTVATYPTASQSTFNLVSSDNDDNNAIELETAEESDQPIEQGWISTSREWSMVVCFAIMAMMVSMDTLIMLPILPVSRLSRNYHKSLDLTNNTRISPKNTTLIHQEKEIQCGLLRFTSSPTQHCNAAMSHYWRSAVEGTCL